MKHYFILVSILIYFKSFSQIISPSGHNIFYYNGSADVVFKYPERGSRGRAFVHAPLNILDINYEGDFRGETMIGNDVYFKDGATLILTLEILV